MQRARIHLRSIALFHQVHHYGYVTSLSAKETIQRILRSRLSPRAFRVKSGLGISKKFMYCRRESALTNCLSAHFARFEYGQNHINVKHDCGAVAISSTP